jgi:hypothetical protein
MMVRLNELSQNSQPQCRQGGTTTFKLQVLNEASLHEDVEKIPQCPWIILVTANYSLNVKNNLRCYSILL